MTALGENLAALHNSAHNRKCHARRDMTIPHFIRKEKEIVVLKCLACN